MSSRATIIILVLVVAVGAWTAGRATADEEPWDPETRAENYEYDCWERGDFGIQCIDPNIGPASYFVVGVDGYEVLVCRPNTSLRPSQRNTPTCGTRIDRVTGKVRP